MSFNLETRVFEKEYRSWEIDLSNLQPLHSGVLIKRLPEIATLLVLTDSVPRHRGRALRVGPGKRAGDGSRRPMATKVGDVVQYQSADVDNGAHVLIEEADILFIEVSKERL